MHVKRSWVSRRDVDQRLQAKVPVNRQRAADMVVKRNVQRPESAKRKRLRKETVLHVGSDIMPILSEVASYDIRP